MGKKVFLNEFSALEVKQLLEHRQDVVAIVPFGSCESHGWHCPLGPDYFVPTEVARRVAERLEDVIVVPCLPYGTSIHYNRFPLSLTLRFETVQAVAEDVLEECAKWQDRSGNGMYQRNRYCPLGYFGEGGRYAGLKAFGCTLRTDPGLCQRRILCTGKRSGWIETGD